MSGPCNGALLTLTGKRGQIFLQGRDRLNSDLWEPCRAEATRIVATGCVHEHIQRAPACAECATAALATANDGKRANCWPCKRAGCNDCPVIVAIEKPQAVAT